MSGLAIFDCDGTLVDSQLNICRAMEICFASAGLEPPDRQRTRQVVGLSLIEAMRAMMPGAEEEVCAELADAYKKAFHQMRAEGPIDEPLYDGIVDLLDGLETAGWQLGVATGKSDRGLALCLEQHGLMSRFATLQTADRHPSKPHPSMIVEALAETGCQAQDSLMIGDTSFDMAMARAAGVMAVGAGWGYHEKSELIAAGADLVIDHPSSLLEQLKAAA